MKQLSSVKDLDVLTLNDAMERHYDHETWEEQDLQLIFSKFDLEKGIQ